MTNRIIHFIFCLIEYIGNEIISNIPSHKIRLFYYRHILNIKIGDETSISLHCKVYLNSLRNNILIGNNCAINQECYLDGRGTLIIGHNVNIGRHVYIYTAQHDIQSPDFQYITKKVTIEDNVWIASNCIIIPGVKIGKGAVVAAGAVVTRDIKPYIVVGGNPAKEIKKRNKNIKYKTKWFKLFY